MKIHLIRTYELSEFFIVKENYLHNIEFCLSKSDVALIFYSLSCTKKLIHNVIINSLRQLRNFVFIVHHVRSRKSKRQKVTLHVGVNLQWTAAADLVTPAFPETVVSENGESGIKFTSGLLDATPVGFYLVWFTRHYLLQNNKLYLKHELSWVWDVPLSLLSASAACVFWLLFLTISQ